jgi:hypothetical protein
MINLINEMVTFTLNKRRTGDASGGYTECVTSNPSDMADHAYAGALYPITVIVTGGTSLLQVGHRKQPPSLGVSQEPSAKTSAKA